MFDEKYCPATLAVDCNIMFNEEYYPTATLAEVVVLCLMRSTALQPWLEWLYYV